MTKQEVLNKIQQFIIANSNNEITADVLRPILEDILNQPNTLVGELSNLGTIDKDSIVDAINEVRNSINNGGITIHTGTTDPNVTPPPSYELGDFYKFMTDGALTAFYIFNGAEWVLLINQPRYLQKDIQKSATSYIVKETDYTVIAQEGILATDTIVLPLPADAFRRIVRIINRSSVTVNLNVTVEDITTGQTINTVASYSVIEVHSDGTNWYKING